MQGKGWQFLATLKHEVWQDPQGLTMICLAGPMGDAARSLQEPGSVLLCVIEGDSHFDAMTKYYRYMGWGDYSTDQSWDLKPYPEEWRVVQDSASPSDCQGS
jgi:hypothetical protein